jgi:hypothetical protein
MEPGTIYEEKIFSKWITAILVPVTFFMVLILIYQILMGPVGTNPASNLFLLGMFLLFLGLTITFSRLIIRIAPGFISVGFGFFKQKISLENIENCYLDEASAVKYGGSGIRIGRVEGKWRLVYSIIGGPRIVLSLRKERFKEVAFSTKQPEKIIRTLKEWTGIP